MSDDLSPLRLFFVFLGLLLPTLALIPLGSLWLWQHGYLIYWALATLLCTALAFVFERRTLGPAPKEPRDDEAGNAAAILDPFDGDPSRAEAEAAVEVFAKDANTRTISTWNDFLNTGLETVEIVAKIYHPDRKDPMLRFTVPEALTLVEQMLPLQWRKWHPRQRRPHPPPPVRPQRHLLPLRSRFRRLW
jgi:hypothetical protein